MSVSGLSELHVLKSSEEVIYIFKQPLDFKGIYILKTEE